jgi:hypothetical protein
MKVAKAKPTPPKIFGLFFPTDFNFVPGQINRPFPHLPKGLTKLSSLRSSPYVPQEHVLQDGKRVKLIPSRSLTHSLLPFALEANRLDVVASPKTPTTTAGSRTPPPSASASSAPTAGPPDRTSAPSMPHTPFTTAPPMPRIFAC